MDRRGTLMASPITADDIVQSLSDELPRPALVARLGERWDKALTTITAPGGYGKTRVLAQTIRHNETAPVGVDFYLRCRSVHADPNRLVQGMLAAIGVDPEGHDDYQVLLDRLIDELAMLAPTKVGLIIDDVHLAGGEPAVVDVLATLVRGLPTNCHATLVGRTIPELPLARLRADDAVIEIDADDLVFDSGEVAQLAERHDVDPDLLAGLAGWPALVRLALVAGKTGPQNYLMHEIVDELPAAVAQGLAVAVLAGDADDDLMQRCGVELPAAELANRVPMLDVLPSGAVRPHDLWTDLIEHLLPEDDAARLVETVAHWHSEHDRYDEGIVLANSQGADGVARSVLMDALGSSDQLLSAAATGRWLELFGGAEQVTAADADLLLLRGWHARLANGPGHGDDDVEAALVGFNEKGDVRGEAHASVESAFRGYMAGDVAKIAAAVERGPRLVAAGMEFLRSLSALTNAVVADINGDVEAAIDHSLRAVSPDTRPDFVELGLRHRATLYFLAGDTDAIVRTTEQLVDFSNSPGNRRTHLGALFLAGDIDGLVGEWDELRYPETGNKREDFVAAVESVFIDACLGLTPDLSTIRSVEWQRPRERFQQALCEWCAELIAGNEEQANPMLAAHIAELGIDEPLVRNDIRRYLVSGYVAVPDARAFLEDEAADGRLGEYQRSLLGLARILVALREGLDPDWSAYGSASQTLSAMSLPWSGEIACGLVEHDQDLGLELADLLFSYCGARPQRWLRALADGEGVVAAGAQRLLALLPAPPQEVTTLQTQGDVLLSRAGSSSTIGRARVRQLLLLLVLRGSLSRDAAMTMLWPDKDIDKARNNLRITLTHLRNDLEPDRRTGEPSYHLRQRGDEIVLHRSEYLRVDLWDMIDALTAAESAGRDGDRAARRSHLAQVARSWKPPLLVDLIDIEDVRLDVESLQAELIDATLEAAEAAVSAGDWELAQHLAIILLEHDRYEERAHAALIASHLGADNESQARQAIDHCVDALAEIGVTPAPSTRMLMRRAHYEDSARRTA